MHQPHLKLTCTLSYCKHIIELSMPENPYKSHIRQVCSTAVLATQHVVLLERAVVEVRLMRQWSYYYISLQITVIVHNHICTFYCLSSWDNTIIHWWFIQSTHSCCFVTGGAEDARVPLTLVCSINHQPIPSLTSLLWCCIPGFVQPWKIPLGMMLYNIIPSHII